MKRILIMVLVGVMAFSVVALGGFKFGAEQGVDTFGVGSYPLTGYVGYDFDYPFIDTGPISIAGDFVVSRVYDWKPGLTGILDFDGELSFKYTTVAKVVLTGIGVFNYAQLPDKGKITGVELGAEIIGYANDALTLNAGVVAPLTGAWVYPRFFFGFDAAW